MAHTHSCTKCSANLDTHWSFCPHCGGTGAHNVPKPQKLERAPARFAFTGLLLGFVTAPVLIIYGTMICLLGPPMVLGIPLIVMGILAPFVGPYLAINAIRGKCPWCDAKITSVGPLDAFYCHACSKPVVIRQRELFKAEPDVAAKS